MKMTECSFQQNEVGEAFWINKDKRTLLIFGCVCVFFCGTVNSFSDLKKKKEPPTCPPRREQQENPISCRMQSEGNRRGEALLMKRKKTERKKKSVKKIIWVPEYYVAHRRQKKIVVCDVTDILSVWFLDDFSPLSSDSPLFYFFIFFTPSTPHD